jgi:hypothetical protein
MSSARGGTEWLLVRRDIYSGDEEELAVGHSPVEIEAQLETLLDGDKSW